MCGRSGENLFETILLNCCVEHVGGLSHEAPPTWATNESFLRPGPRRTAKSLVQGFTWQPRQVQSCFRPEVECARIPATPRPFSLGASSGDRDTNFPGHATWLDPNVAYRLDEKDRSAPRSDRGNIDGCGGIIVPLFLSLDKESGADKFSRPAIVTQLSRLKAEGILDHDKAEHFEVYGMRTDKSESVRVAI